MRLAKFQQILALGSTQLDMTVTEARCSLPVYFLPSLTTCICIGFPAFGRKHQSELRDQRVHPCQNPAAVRSVGSFPCPRYFPRRRSQRYRRLQTGCFSYCWRSSKWGLGSRTVICCWPQPLQRGKPQDLGWCRRSGRGRARREWCGRPVFRAPTVLSPVPSAATHAGTNEAPRVPQKGCAALVGAAQHASYSLRSMR